MFPKAVTLLCILTFSAFPANPESPWDGLRHLSKRHIYTVLTRDGSCVTGNFVALTDNTFVIDQGGEKPIPKAEIVRISAGDTADVHTTVFSARSSWADVQALQSPPYYSSLLLFTSDSRRFSGPLIGVSSDQLILMVDGKEMRFAKDFLARVLLTGKKPAFEGSGGHWNPMDLPKKVISPPQPVPLFEAGGHEDNVILDCSSPDSLRHAK